MATPKIKSFTSVVPMIYAYNTPGVLYHEGWTKIGYTEKQSVADRIKQQTHTAGIKPVIAWQDNAIYKDGSGEYFTDYEFHGYLEIGERGGTKKELNGSKLMVLIQNNILIALQVVALMRSRKKKDIHTHCAMSRPKPLL